MAEAKGPAKSRLGVLQATRDPYLLRARGFAELTIPFLCPPQGATGSTNYPQPWQSAAAEGINTLASKLLLTLFPPNKPPMKLNIPDEVRKEADRMGDQGAQVKGEIEKALAAIERRVVEEIEGANVRATLFEAVRHLINNGSCLLYTGKDKLDLKLYSLDSHVVRRAANGTVLEIVVCEEIAAELLPEVLRTSPHISTPNKVEAHELLTHIKRTPSGYVTYQECCGIEVPGTRGTYPLTACPWIPLRWRKLDGEHYGRGHVEEHIGDIAALDALWQALTEGSIAAAKMLTLVNPSGVTNPDDIAKARNLDVVSGREEDVKTLQANKFADFRVALEAISQLEARVSRAFLKNIGAVRNAERVTAEEIRMLASELEDVLGGTFSLLAKELVAPLVARVMYVLTREGSIPDISDKVTPTIVAGLSSLGRGVNLQLMLTFAQTIINTLGPESFAKVVDARAFAREAGTAIGFEVERILLTKEQIAAREQAEQASAMASNVVPAAMQADSRVQAAQIAQQGKQ